MKFELIVCRKRLDSSPNVLKDFGAIQIRDFVWGFESNGGFLDVYKKVCRAIKSDYKFVLIGLDGTEDAPIPNLVRTNDKTIEYYLRALEGKGAEVRYAIRIGSELHYSNEERRLRKRGDKEQTQEAQS